MPDRIVRHGILTSDRVNQLSPHGEIFYRRLLNVVDDYGRYDGRLPLIRSACYPLRLDTTSEASINDWLKECEEAGLLVRYVVDGKPYLQIDNLGEPRAKKSRYPDPPAQTDAPARTCNHVRADEDTRQQTTEDVPPFALRLSSAPIECRETSCEDSRPQKSESQQKAKRQGGSPAVAFWVDTMRERYPGVPYKVNGRDAGSINSVLKYCGGDMDAFGKLVIRFFDDPDPFLAKEMHSPCLLASRPHKWSVDRPDTPRRGVHDDGWPVIEDQSEDNRRLMESLGL